MFSMPIRVFCFTSSSLLKSFDTVRSKPRVLIFIFIQNASLEKSAKVTLFIAVGWLSLSVSETYLLGVITKIEQLLD